MAVSTRPERRAGVEIRRTGPVPSFDRGAIVEAAIALADEGGLTAVSMRAVATRMGTSASALYRYVADRAELLGLMADRVVSELRSSVPPRDGGVDAMVKVGSAQRDLYRRHPWLTGMAFHPSDAGPETLRHFDACLGALASTSMSTRAKFEAIALVTGLAALLAPLPAQPAPTGGGSLARVDPAVYPHLAAAAAEAAAAADDVRNGPAQEQDDLLERVTRGVLRGLIDDVEPHS